MPTPTPQELTEVIVFWNTGKPVMAATGIARQVSVFATVWARITEGSGAIDDQDQQHQRQVNSFEVWTQYLTGLTSFHQIAWGSRTLVQVGAPTKVQDRYGRWWWLIAAKETIERSV